MERVNCLALVDGQCTDGRYRRPDSRVCLRICRHRRPIDPGAGPFVPLRVGGEAATKPRQAVERKPPPSAVPREEWPAAVEIVAKLATDADTGIGDTIERIGRRFLLGPIYKSFWTAVGTSCGCARRRDSLNSRFPYA
jgi:hypothetical protein